MQFAFALVFAAIVTFAIGAFSITAITATFVVNDPHDQDAALFLVAVGGTPTPTATASPSPTNTFTPTPTPTPAQVNGLYGVQPATGLIVKINPGNGVISSSYAAPGGISPANTLIGLSMAEGDSVLLYRNANVSSSLIRLDPTTGTALSSSTTTGSTDDGLSYETNAGTNLIFHGHQNSDLHRQTGFGGSTSTNWETGAPRGGLGGDGHGRQFGYFTDGFIHEYSPTVDDNTFNSFLPSPAADVQGMAFDGTNLYVSTASGMLYTLNPNTGAVLNIATVPGGALYGLAASASVNISTPTASPTPTNTVTATNTPTNTPTSTHTPTRTNTPTPTPTSAGTIFLVVTKVADTNDGVCNADCSLREAIAVANASAAANVIQFTSLFNTTQTIVLSGTRLEILYLGGDLTINGPGANLLTISANQLSNVILHDSSDTLTITGLKIANGKTIDFGHGAGILNQSGDLVIHDSIISDNRAEGWGQGGGIYNCAADVTITGSSIVNNFAGAFGGGGITSGDDCVSGQPNSMLIADSLITNNVTTANGGGIQSENLAVINTTISNNSANFGGGAISDSANFSNVTFSNNTVTQSGGGLNGTNVSLTDCVFSGNSAVVNGGGLALGDSPQKKTIIRTTFSSNTALDGGAIYNYRSLVSIQDSTLNNNIATRNGGALYHDNASTSMSIFSSTLIGNSASRDGGGVYNSSGGLNITGSTVSGNTASAIGGLGGGGAYNQSLLNLTNTTFSGNTTIGKGGAIYNAGGASNISRTTICNNQAAIGGGVFNAVILRSNTTIFGDNVATTSGADFAGILTSQGYNLIEDTSGLTTSGITTGNILGQDAMLGQLADNGGPTWTAALLLGSPALDRGSAAWPAVLIDQRNFPRPYDDPSIPNAVGGDGSDIGAFERQSVEPPPTQTATNTPTLTPTNTLTPTATASPTPAECNGDVWTSTSTSISATQRKEHAAVWTGTEMIIWGGFVGLDVATFNPTNTGARYNPVTNTWTPTTTVNAPSARVNFTAVWTGAEMIVWGGDDNNGVYYNTGGRYNPATNRWTPISTLNAPNARAIPRSVWTGTEMLVWGGSYDIGQTNTGGRYNPALDVWTPISTTNAPNGRFGHTTVWTGTEMIVWGGYSSGNVNTGGRYNPGTDAWTATNTTGAPTERGGHTAVWTGSEMIVWGGIDNALAGGRYNPSIDSWTGTTVIGQPTERRNHTAIWTGSEMIVWGGDSVGFSTETNTGGRYMPTTNTWTSTIVAGSPASRQSHTAVWTGGQMIIWGGADAGGHNAKNTGGKYCAPPPTPTSSPTPTSTSTATATGTATNTATASPTPTPCGTPGPWVYKYPYPQLVDSAGVTTDGNSIYVFGGKIFTTSSYDSVNRYDPSSDSWTPLAPIPTGPDYAVGAEYGENGKIYVMGGVNSSTANRIYNIASGTWTTGAPLPAGRRNFAHAYHGGKIYVIGGYPASGFVATNTVYAYILDEDTWQTLSPLPAARNSSAAVAINGRLYVVGGSVSSPGTHTDLSVYDIATNTWGAGANLLSTTSSPAASVVGGKLWLIGRASSGVTTQISDPANDSWLVGPPLNRGRSQTGAATLRTMDVETVYVVGGFDAGVITALDSVEANTVFVCSTATPTASPSPTNTPTNTATATNTPTPLPEISGVVTYANATGGAQPVSGVTVTGVGSPNVTATTGPPGATAGQYTLTGFGPGPYTVVPSKTGGINGSITSFDAAKIAQHVAGINTLSGNPFVVADVSGNGTLSSFDAGQLARYVAAVAGSGSTGNWIFNPVNRMYASITTNISGEDYSALLMGEVSGNWTNTGARSAGSSQMAVGGGPERSAVVELPILLSPLEKELIVPITVSGAANKGIISYEFDLRYDPTVIQPQENPVDLTGTVSRGLTAVANLNEPGLLRVVMYGPMPIESNGVLLNLRFTAVGAPGTVSPLTFERIMFNEGDPGTLVTNGQITLSEEASLQYSSYENVDMEPPLPVILAYAKLAEISTDILIDDRLNLTKRR